MTDYILGWVFLLIIPTVFIPGMWLGDKLSFAIRAFRAWAKAETEEDYSEY